MPIITAPSITAPNSTPTAIDLAGRLRASVLEDQELSTLIAALDRDGIHVSVIRELHEWDAATATVTSHLTCAVDGCDAEGVGVARDRVSASVLAIRSAVGRRAGSEARPRISA
jgi:hypothetical protein